MTRAGVGVFDFCVAKSLELIGDWKVGLEGRVGRWGVVEDQGWRRR